MKAEIKMKEFRIIDDPEELAFFSGGQIGATDWIIRLMAELAVKLQEKIEDLLTNDQ